MLEGAARKEPDRYEVHVALGELLLRHGKTAAAVRALQKVPESSLERRGALTWLVPALDRLGLHEASGEAGEPLWGEQALYGVDPQSTPRTQAGDEFDDAGVAPYSTGDEAEVARERIVALLGPSPITLDELARAAEASARMVRVALLELEVAGRVEYSGDRVALRATVNEI